MKKCYPLHILLGSHNLLMTDAHMHNYASNVNVTSNFDKILCVESDECHRDIHDTTSFLHYHYQNLRPALAYDPAVQRPQGTGLGIHWITFIASIPRAFWLTATWSYNKFSWNIGIITSDSASNTKIHYPVDKSIPVCLCCRHWSATMVGNICGIWKKTFI